MSVEVLAVVQDVVRELQSIIVTSVNNTATQVVTSMQAAIQQIMEIVVGLYPFGGIVMNVEWLESIDVGVLASALDAGNTAPAAYLPPLA